MKLQFEMFQRAEGLREQLERAGWNVDQDQGGSLVASHRFVADEPDARLQLSKMGLLTSRKVRIRFLPERIQR
jgi:hypothetical protein